MGYNDGAVAMYSHSNKADIGRQVMLAEEAKPLTYRNAMLQKKAADLIDHSGSLADQARSHPVQCL
jgi:hypothetical protein